MNTTETQLKPGDKVKISPYKVQSMRYQGQLENAWASNMEGWIVSLKKSRTWMASDDSALIVVMPTDDYSREMYITESLDVVQLLEAGKNRLPLIGIDTPLPEYYARHTIYEDYEYKDRKADKRFQGYTNAATHLAALYLANDYGAYQALHRERRADGTINPNKVEKIFKQFKLVVDAWAFEPFIPFPHNWNGPTHVYKPRINWAEVAEDFSAENA